MAILIDSSNDIEIYSDTFNFKVYAGPGAGKTHLIIQNLKHIIENSKKITEDRRVLCITYTNVAVDEIKSRLVARNKYVHTSTIHSFLYQYVIRNYEEQLRFLIKEKYGLEISKSVSFKSRIEGEGLLAMVKKEEIDDFLVNNSTYSYDEILEIGKFDMSQVIINLKDRNIGNYEDVDYLELVEVKKIPKDLRWLIKEFIWTKYGLLDFDEILYFSYELLKKYKHIRIFLRYAFPYVLIDEYQDTNPIQNKLIKLFADNPEVTLGVVGDMAQSIYSFNGANFREFRDFETTTKQVKKFVIENNRRSNQNIVHFINFIRQKDVSLSIQKCISNTSNEKVEVIFSMKHVARLNHHISDEDTILCRRFIDALSYVNDIVFSQQDLIRKINNYYVYGLSRNLVSDFDSNKYDWMRRISFVVNMVEAVKKSDFSKILSLCEYYIDTNPLSSSSDKSGHYYKNFLKFLPIFNEINEDDSLYKISEMIEKSANNCNLKLINSFIEDEFLENSVVLSNLIDQLEFKTMKVMVKEIYTKESKFMTIHRSKGKEYKSVVLNITPASYSEKKINVIEVLSNPDIYSEKLDGVEGEYLRIVYVGASRAINKLKIFVKGTQQDANDFKNAINDYRLKLGITEEFAEISFE